MRSEIRTQEWFLKDPKTRRWILQCAACGQYGKDPNSPQDIPKVNFENMFPDMVLDDRGFCQFCGPRIK